MKSVKSALATILLLAVVMTLGACNSTQEYIEASFDKSDEKTECTTQSNTINLSEYEASAIVSITAAGEYILSGTLTDGQVVVDVGDKEKVQLYLDNAEITKKSTFGTQEREIKAKDEGERSGVA